MKQIDHKTDYWIFSKPAYAIFTCPYCDNDVKLPFDAVDYNTDYWGDGALATCPECGKEVELGDYEYD